MKNNSQSDSRSAGSNIVLTGMSGSGKSTIGRQLAKLIGRGFIDLDDYITRRMGRKVSDIFEKDGEAVFREYELQSLTSLRATRSHVIAVGGGALLTEDALDRANQLGPIVWIQSSPQEIARRIFKRVDEIERRPLFRDLVTIEDHEIRRESIRARIQKILDERRVWYARAQVVLDGSYVTSEMAAQHLIDILTSERLIAQDRHRFASWRRSGGRASW